MTRQIMQDQMPRMAQIVNEAAAKLQPEYGERGIPSEVLKREIERIGSYGKDSVIPSDYCYNVVNRASYSFRHPLLIRVSRGMYRYIGTNHPYSGTVMWKPNQGAERQVGRWSNGVCHLEFDPRQ